MLSSEPVRRFCSGLARDLHGWEANPLHPPVAPSARSRYDPPMRIYISVDMEGVAGVVHEDQTNPVDPRCAGEYARFRRLMTDEANAAITGALEGGATRVVVNDSHWTMRNLLAEALHPEAELVSGSPKLGSMMEGVELGFDAALFVGYHARAGTMHATIDHTYTDRIHEVRLNGRPAGELPGRSPDRRRTRPR